MHSLTAHLDQEELLKEAPLTPTLGLRKVMWTLFVIGLVSLTYGIVALPPKVFWTSYYVNVIFWTGVSCGMVVLCAIFQIVRAQWAVPLRRVCESGASFLPYAYILILSTYMGREYLFPWATKPFPGREWWFQPDFVYGRMTILLAVLFFLLWRFVRISVRSDVGTIREKNSHIDRWFTPAYDSLVGEWKGADVEVKASQAKLSWNAPLIIAVYAVVYSLFVFEMIMSMDKYWFSNMFGGYVFLANIYTALAFVAITLIYLARTHQGFSRILTSQQMWDVGKLSFGFCMLWGYTFFSQFLPQWYGNLPEETQWMIARTREMPWQGLGWVVFGMCFVVPFVTLLSRDLKKTAVAYSVIASIILVGIWLEKYLIIAPQLFPDSIPLSLFDVGLTAGFLGAFVLCVHSFLAKYPYVTASSPLVRGDDRW